MLTILVGITIILTIVSDALNPLKTLTRYEYLAWLLFLAPFSAFVLTVVLKKKYLMLCMRNQVVEGHMIDFEIDRIESESDQKILGKEKLDTKENEQIQHA